MTTRGQAPLGTCRSQQSGGGTRVLAAVSDLDQPPELSLLHLRSLSAV